MTDKPDAATAIADALAKMTRGEWYYIGDGQIESPDDEVPELPFLIAENAEDNDAAGICTLKNRAPELLAENAALKAEIERLREALREADDALCEYACHGGLKIPCRRTPNQCRSECGRAAADALVVVRAALNGDA